MDVKTALLHRDIVEEVYITSAKGLNICSPDEVLQLQKGMYGLKQSLRLWYDKWNKIVS